MEHVTCGLCRGDNERLVCSATDMGLHLPGVFRIVQCQDCGLVYINPRPARDEIGAYYPADAYYTCQPAITTGLRSTIKRLIRESMPGYGRDASWPSRIVGRFLGLLFSWQIDVLVPHREDGRVLDVGCGNGQITGWMTQHGWEVHGVDPAPMACKQAARAGLSVFCGELADAGYPDGHFDAIVVNHVLEHAHDPIGLLRECHRVLRADGLIVIDVPNYASLDAKIFGPYWAALEAPRHLYHFTPATLERAIRDAGFAPAHWKLKAPIPVLDKSSLRNLKKSGAGRTASALAKTYMTKPLLMLSGARRVECSPNLTIYAEKA